MTRPTGSKQDVSAELASLVGRAGALEGDQSLPQSQREAWRRAADRLLDIQTEIQVAADRPVKQSRSRLAWVGLTVIGAALATVGVVLRTWGVLTGVVYGSDPVRYVNAITASGVIAVVAGLILRRKGKKKATADNVSQALALVSALVTAIALAGIFVPPVPGSAGDTACPGARTNGTPYIAAAAATVNGGVNARSHPNRTALQVDRYPTDCLIGFDGFCIGEPITDATYTGDPRRKDARWLRVARHRTSAWQHRLAKWISGEPDQDRYIAAGNIQARTLLDLDKLKFDCGAADPSVEALSLKVDQTARTVTGNVRTDHDAEDVQYAIFIAGAVTNGGTAYRQITADDRQQMLWKSAVTGATLVTDNTVVVVVAVPCLAPSIPPLQSGLIQTQTVSLNRDGSVKKLPATAQPNTFDEAAATDEACKAIE